ncbi:hypothetical protein [Bacillus andreraoultii]|nr:hypothetical protein [Bacillus andreraoultii]
MSNWLTPEEIARKRDYRKKALYISIPIIGAILGALIGLISQFM